MNRGDLFRVRRPGGGDPRRSRVFVVVSRQTLIDSLFSTVVCAPVYTRRDGLADYVASLAPPRVRALNQALRVALALA